jgi:hypothetical protein
MFDLEFKEARYGRSDSEKRKLAGDVAAMANAAGGVILIGIAEDEQGCAAAAPGVDYTEAEKLQIQQVIAAGISPVPTFDVETIPDDLAVQSSEEVSRDLGKEVRSQHGFILIAALRTTSAPHAALIDEKLRFPVRSGTTTRYLSQPEVAAASQNALLVRRAKRTGLPRSNTMRSVDSIGKAAFGWSSHSCPTHQAICRSPLPRSTNFGSKPCSRAP